MLLNMIKQMERHARQDDSVISLGQGIPAGKANDHIHRRVIAALAHEPEIDRYSDPLGMLQLRQAIASDLRQAGMQYSSDEILVTGGAIEAINATLLTLVSSEKNEVIIPVPTYSAYERAVTVAKGRTVPVPLREAHDWQVSLSDIKAAITPRTAALLLCNPNNPTGSLYDERTLTVLCELAQKHDFMLLVDEVYGNMLFNTEKLYSPAMNASYKKQVIRIVSFSKDFNLTGWRIGFLHSDLSVIERIVPIHDTLLNCAPVPSQYAALAALEISHTIIPRNRLLYAARKELMQTYLDSMSHWFSYTAPEGGYFFFPKLLFDMSAQEFCQQLVTKARVIAIPGDDFGAKGEYIRLCFGRSSSDIHEGMKRIRQYLQTYCA